MITNKHFGSRNLKLFGAMLLAMATAAASADGGNVAESISQLARDSSPEDLKNAEIDFEYDAVQCAAYYSLESALAQKSGYGDTDSGRGMAQAATAATQLAVEVSQVVGMSMDAVKALMKIDMDQLVERLGKDYVNSPLVVQTVGMPCKAMLEHPADRIAHWLRVEREKHASQ